MTVHATLSPFINDVCAQLTDDTAMAPTSVRAVVTVCPADVAETFAVESAVNVPALAVKLALDAPCATLTVDGTVSCALSLASAIAVPLLTTEDRLNVQLEDAPGATDVGVHTIFDNEGAGSSVTAAPFDTPVEDAVTCATMLVLTADAAGVKAAEEAPARIVTDGGTLS